MTHQQLTGADLERMDARTTAAVAAATRTGSHLWAALLAYRVNDPTMPDLMLDTENLLNYPTVGCFICEEPYSPRLAYRRCPGEPA